MLESNVEIFPSFAPDLENRSNVRPMEPISNLEVVKDFEFDHEFIGEMVRKFSLTPNLCNRCNDYSKWFLNPTHYINELYVKNARWVACNDSVMSMDVEPYNRLQYPVYDISNVGLIHPKS